MDVAFTLPYNEIFWFLQCKGIKVPSYLVLLEIKKWSLCRVVFIFMKAILWRCYVRVMKYLGISKLVVSNASGECESLIIRWGILSLLRII
jgi:hypothetical protein